MNTWIRIAEISITVITGVIAIIEDLEKGEA
ncbi:Uncharacterised protein [Staphylococcus cohnii]|nr:Uncharacterised protein [Staphylococcus cohnii]